VGRSKSFPGETPIEETTEEPQKRNDAPAESTSPQVDNAPYDCAAGSLHLEPNLGSPNAMASRIRFSAIGPESSEFASAVGRDVPQRDPNDPQALVSPNSKPAELVAADDAEQQKDVAKPDAALGAELNASSEVGRNSIPNKNQSVFDAAMHMGQSAAADKQIELAHALAIGKVEDLKNSLEISNARARFIPEGGIVAAEGWDMTKDKGKVNQVTSQMEQKLPLTVGATRGLLESDSAATNVSARGQNSFSWLPLAEENRFASLSERVGSARGLRGSATTDDVALQISQQAIALKHFNADSMAVVLRPDPNTAIFLHLRLQGGEVEVHARFESGNYAALSEGWSQLQRSLAPQGIRLGPLDEPLSNLYTSSDSTFGSFGHDQGEKRSPTRTVGEEDLDRQTTRVGPVPKRLKPRPARMVAGDSRQWESWA
jgi:hypothetical protein